MQPAHFAGEEEFQSLLADFPILLVGDQIDPENPRRWVLVKREQAVGLDDASGGRWSIDHVFLDQDGIPTLVEIKRQTDTRIRREVVGQMLDYAANCSSFWALGALRSSFERTCAAAGQPSEAVLAELLGAGYDVDAFWARVERHLSQGQIRLLFVADVIPVELRRIVEFLNRQMSPAEVLAIELRQFEGQGIKTIVPMVFGQSEASASKKANTAPGETWNEARFFEKFKAEKTEAETTAAQCIFDSMRSCGEGLVFGTGRIDGSVYPLLRPGGVKVNPVYMSTDGKLWFQLPTLKGKPVFDDIELRRELMNRFAFKGAGFDDADLDRYKALPLSLISADPESPARIRAAFAWLDQVVKNGSTKPRN